MRAVRGSTASTLKIHLSHWYPWGTMLYGRFVIPDGGPDAAELHDAIWRDASRAPILGAGGVMNDHHGVGLKLAPYMRAQYGAALDTLRRIKEALDPNGIMNPGKLGSLTKGGDGWHSRWRCTTGCGPSRSKSTIERLAECGYDAIEIMGEPELYDDRDEARAPCSTKHGLALLGRRSRSCSDGRDLAARGRVRARRGRPVRQGRDRHDARSSAARMLTVVPVHGRQDRRRWRSPEEEWQWAVDEPEGVSTSSRRGPKAFAWRSSR